MFWILNCTSRFADTDAADNNRSLQQNYGYQFATEITGRQIISP